MSNTVSSLANEAYAAIKQDIILCRLAPATAVSEARLAIAYGFGKAAVRNALTRLSQEGLVNTQSRRGHIIAPLALADIKEIFLLREHLEPFAARRAAGHVNEAQLRALNDVCRAGYESGDQDSEMRFLDANRRFHLSIAEAAGSPRLIGWMEQLHNEATRILYLSFRLGDKSIDWTHGHETLLDALICPSPDDAERIARELLVASEEEVLRAALNSPRLLNVALM
jgi:DNA-binding GntR family transcriptional regulator